MDLHTLAVYALTCVLLAFMPGADIFYVLSSSLASGFKTGFCIALGLCAGVVVHTLLCAAGVSLIVAGSPALMNCVRLFGAAYLGYLAYAAMRSKPEAFRAGGGAEGVGFARLFARGFLMNVSNPKVIIFFLSFFPEFMKEGGAPEWLQICVLGAIFLLSALACFSLTAFCAARLARVFASLAFARFMRALSAAVFGALAVSLAAEIFI